MDKKPDHEKHWLVRRSSIRILWVIFAVVLAATVAGGFFAHPHIYFGVDGTPAFYAWFGLLSCACMVVFAKVLGILIKRPDDYYDGE